MLKDIIHIKDIINVNIHVPSYSTGVGKIFFKNQIVTILGLQTIHSLLQLRNSVIVAVKQSYTIHEWMSIAVLQ